MQFIDQAIISVQSGTGGHGSKSFRREKYIPRGGPDGGDGGKGGDVILVADNRSRTLHDYHHKRLYAAEDGKDGMTARKTGRDGEDLVLFLPPGTQIFDDATGVLLADLTEADQRIVLLNGGNGGWGNVRFASATRQTPDHANPGLAGQRKTLRLELKLLADVALVGYPNAGKSSLIRQVSASRAVVADYPFTTLVPNLGVVRHHDRVFTMADIPGLVPGAAEGAGLGIRFLRHIERCRILVYVLSPVDKDAPDYQWMVLQRELHEHDPKLLERPSLVVLSKVDALGPDAAVRAKEVAELIGQPVLPISSLDGTGIDRLLTALALQFPPETPAMPPLWNPLED
jgi:GTP-binding protein